MAVNDVPQEGKTFESTQGKDSKALASMITDRYTQAAQTLRTEMRDYWLNHAFLHGYQWLYWSEVTDRLDELPSDPERVQATINRMWPNTRTIISTLMQRELVFEVPASAADDSHVRGARLAETIARAIHHDQNWEELRENGLLATLKGGTAAMCVDWDPDADPILADDTQGAPAIPGDTYNEHLNITQFAVEPGTRYPEQARWWVKVVAHPPRVVKEMFDLDEVPPANGTAGLGAFQRKLMAYDRGDSQELMDLTLVLTYYERPNEETPDGRVVVVVGNEVVFEDEWPFPFKDRLNLVIMRETLKENRWTGDTVLTAGSIISTLDCGISRRALPASFMCSVIDDQDTLNRV